MAALLITVRHGVNFDAYFDSYTDESHATRIDYDGWRFTLALALTGRDDLTWSTDDEDAALTVVDAANPTGKRLAWHLSAAETTAIPRDGTLTLLRIDPDDTTNVQELTQPITVTIAGRP